MKKEQNFSHLTHFPGEEGNPFDQVLRTLEKLDQIPAVLFVIILVFIACAFTLGDLYSTASLLFFYLTDWQILALLNRAGKSYGPPKPPTLMLALMRGIAFLLPAGLGTVAQGIGTLLCVYGFWIEPHSIKVTYRVLKSTKLGFSRPLRLLHLSDLHIERITSRERQLNQIINNLQPDIILFSGDILNLSYLRDLQAHQAARVIMQDWNAELGVYLVSGSPAVDLADVFPGLIKSLPLHHLDDIKVTLEWQGKMIDIIGLTCTQRPHLDGQKLINLINQDQDHFRILVYHTPDLAPIAAKSGIDLQLSGHTHGGQVRLPLFGALMTGSLYGKRFEAGRYNIGPMTLYVSRGIGMEGRGAPRVRFLCPPEIILWEIR